jgi:hypothetical protein
MDGRKEMSMSEQLGSSWNLDRMLIGREVLGPLLVWGVLVGGAAYAGYPGAACLTPMAWLLGCRVGLRCAQFSRSAPRQRMVEAVVAGAVLGLLQGMLFYVLQATLMPASPEEQGKALVLSAVILVTGMLITALLALWTSALTIRRVARQSARG